jgi:lipase chaperone LimK
MNEKFPKVSSGTSRVFSYIKEVWHETFPNEKNKLVTKMERRKEQARMAKEMEENQEFIDKLQEDIPEWKRGAIVTTDQEMSEEKPGLLKRVKSTVKSKITSTKAAQEFMETEDYKKIEKMRAEMSEFKSNLKE